LPPLPHSPVLEQPSPAKHGTATATGTATAG